MPSLRAIAVPTTLSLAKSLYSLEVALEEVDFQVPAGPTSIL